MELIRARTIDEATGRKPVVNRQLLGLLYDRSGEQRFRRGIFDGRAAAVHVEDVHPNRWRRVNGVPTWNTGLEIPELVDHEGLSDAERRLIELGVIPFTLDMQGKGRFSITPTVTWKLTLAREIMGVSIALEEEHGGPRRVRTGGHAEYYPDWSQFNIGSTAPNYLHKVVNP